MKLFSFVCVEGVDSGVGRCAGEENVLANLNESIFEFIKQ